MWGILAEKTIAVVICRFDGSTVQHGLVLDLGDLVEITQQCQDWYLGSNLSSTGSKGIFPKSYVAKTRSLPDPDRWSLYDDPVVEEATNVIREWVVIWRQYYLKRQAESYSALRTAISELIDWRRQLMTGTFTHDHLRDMRLRITTHIDRGNRYRPISFPFCFFFSTSVVLSFSLSLQNDDYSGVIVNGH